MAQYTISKKGLVQKKGGSPFIDVKENIKVDLQGATNVRRKNIQWASDLTLTKKDAGALVGCVAQSGAIDLELPTAAAAGPGWDISLIYMVAGSGDAHIDFQADTAIVTVHVADGGTDSISASAPLEKQSIKFVGGTAVPGAEVLIKSDGDRYYVRAFVGTTAEIAASDSGV